MADVHLTRELLEAVFGEERNPRELIPVVLGHLFDLCPTCEEAFNGWRTSLPVTAALSYGEIASHVVDRASEALERIRAEEEKAKVYLDDLLALTPEERAAFVEREVPEEAKGPALANGLIEAAKGVRQADPHDSLALAQLARTVLQHADLSPFVSELYARAIAYVANAHRVLGRLPEAVEAMAHARFILRQEGGGDRLTRAEIDNLEGLVRLHQHDYPDAKLLLKRAVLGFRFAGVQHDAFIARMNLAIVFRVSGDLRSAITTQRQLNEELERAGEQKLAVFSSWNLAVTLCEAGQYAEAEEMLRKTEPTLRGAIALSRSEWLQGRIAHGRHDLRRAESHYIAARHGFAKADLPFDTALASLELAGVYLDENRWSEVKALASEVVQVFEGQERHSESLAAMVIFRAAAERERLTIDLVKEIVAYLGRAALDPSHKFTTRRASSGFSKPS